MGLWSKSVWSVARTHALSLAIGVLAFGGTVVPTKILAQTAVSFATEPLIVRNDRGGLLRDRLRQIRQTA